MRFLPTALIVIEKTSVGGREECLREKEKETLFILFTECSGPRWLVTATQRVM